MQVRAYYNKLIEDETSSLTANCPHPPRAAAVIMATDCLSSETKKIQCNTTLTSLKSNQRCQLQLLTGCLVKHGLWNELWDRLVKYFFLNWTHIKLSRAYW